MRHHLTSTNNDIFIIKKAEPADIPRMVALINSCYRGETSKQGWTTEADLIAGDIRTDEANISELMALPTTTYLICVHPEAGIVGTVYLDKRGERLYLGMLSVDLAWQASGIGKKLLQAAESHALGAGCGAIFMQVVSERNSLINWYLRHGYNPTGERKPFDGDPRFGVPKVPLEFVFFEKTLAKTA
ncbi:MAG: GNAT family N-acetyltransferase [Bacteroidetes bacterium]|nr:GNAT family N-acetyltransferase [Bacteroidota bacterium]